jgi:hypothetical protein
MPGRRKILTILISAAFAWPLMAQSERAVVQLTYLGTAGWEITDGRTVVLVDPYLSRLRRVTPNDTVDPTDNRPLLTTRPSLNPTRRPTSKAQTPTTISFTASTRRGLPIRAGERVP